MDYSMRYGSKKKIKLPLIPKNQYFIFEAANVDVMAVFRLDLFYQFKRM